MLIGHVGQSDEGECKAQAPVDARNRIGDRAVEIAQDNSRARQRTILAAGGCDPCSPVGPPDARIHEYIALNNRAFCGVNHR